MASRVSSPLAIAEGQYSELLSNYSSSLVPSVCDCEFKHGRRYHSYHSGAYQFPNDEHEQQRLDLCRHIFYKTLHNRLFLAPIDPSGKRILDLGTGTGIWPIAMGDEYPAAALIVGNDLSPIQPQWAPPSPEPDGPYDFIHYRYLCGSIRDWPRLLRQCYEHLRPGGYLEVAEPSNIMYSEDDSIGPDNKVMEMMGYLNMARWVEEAGFRVVQEQAFKMPMGTWPKDRRLKEIGALCAINIVEGVEAFTAVPFMDVLGWTKEEVAALNAAVRADVMQKRDAHMVHDFVVVVAQKPE
ncbi:UMTA methyltransferase family protein [Thermoascus aurantiacus ATCC 26904]